MKELQLVRHVEPDVPDAVVGDAGRLQQVPTNLVGNAIRFTKQSEVAVRVEVVCTPLSPSSPDHRTCSASRRRAPSRHRYASWWPRTASSTHDISYGCSGGTVTW
jgi:hypothetical protein